MVSKKTFSPSKEESRIRGWAKLKGERRRSTKRREQGLVKRNKHSEFQEEKTVKEKESHDLGL
jgi:hypothetical protein